MRYLLLLLLLAITLPQSANAVVVKVDRTERSVRESPSQQVRSKRVERSSRRKFNWRILLGAVGVALAFFFPPLRWGLSLGKLVFRKKRPLGSPREDFIANFFIGVGVLLLLMNLPILGGGLTLVTTSAEALVRLFLLLLGGSFFVRGFLYKTRDHRFRATLQPDKSYRLPSDRTIIRQLYKTDITSIVFGSIALALALILLSQLPNLAVAVLVGITLSFGVQLILRTRRLGKSRAARASDARRSMYVPSRHPRQKTRPPVARTPKPEGDLKPIPPKPKYKPPTPDNRMQNWSVIAVLLMILFLVLMLG